MWMRPSCIVGRIHLVDPSAASLGKGTDVHAAQRKAKDAMTTRPLQVVPVVAAGEHIQLRAGAKTITVENHVEAIWALLKVTNGYRSVDEVVDLAVEETDIERTLLEAVVGDLERLGILVDSRALHETVITYSDNPMPFPSEMRISEYLGYEHAAGWEPAGDRIPLAPCPTHPASKRRSSRAYGNESISIAELASLLQRATDRPPSAGGLYPTRLAVVLNRAVGDLETGVYHYEHGSHSLVSAGDASREEIRYALNREDGVHNAPVVIAVSGDMERQTKKYSNRGWRYTIIEAGIAVERLVNAACDLGLDSLVFGGYDDHVMSRLLYGDDAPRVRTIVTVAVGHGTAENLPDLDLEFLHNQLDELFIGDGRLIESAGATDLWRQPGDLSFHQVLATLRAADESDPSPADERTCGGTGASIVAARAKAIVECIERYASSQVRVDRTGAAIDVNPEFDPAPFVLLDPDQIATSPFLTPFRPDLPLEWVSGRDLHTGAETFVPVDLVYYPLSTSRLGRPILFAANSSGIASHTDPAEATNRALLELMERHAVLTSWHEQNAPFAVPPNALSPYLHNRRRYWQAQGYELHVLDFSTAAVPVAGIAIGSSTKFPAFSFGSAAAINWRDAVVKALHEAEVGIAGHRSLEEEPITAEKVSTPLEHGLFHAYDPDRTAWNFLTSASTPNDYSIPESLRTFEMIIETMRPIAVQIDSPKPIHTFRVLSPSLFPISFGAALEHRPAWSKAPQVPHFIA